jgi:hypothetical protein
MSEEYQQRRAYVSKIKNNKARTSASKEYFQLIVEDGEAYFFTTVDFDRAKKRANKNLEDIIAVDFNTQKPTIIEKIVRVTVAEKSVEVEKAVKARRARRRLTLQKSYKLIK